MGKEQVKSLDSSGTAKSPLTTRKTKSIQPEAKNPLSQTIWAPWDLKSVLFHTHALTPFPWMQKLSANISPVFSLGSANMWLFPKTPV
jgi:hypothetical protein